MTNKEISPVVMNVILWVLQVLIAAMFLMTGTMKVFTPIDKLAMAMPWVANAEFLVRFIGISELLGGIGLILPALLRVKPILTAWAAIGIATIMVFATVFHISRGEYSAIRMTLMLGIIAVFIAWGRMKKSIIESR